MKLFAFGIRLGSSFWFLSCHHRLLDSEFDRWEVECVCSILSCCLKLFYLLSLKALISFKSFFLAWESNWSRKASCKRLNPREAKRQGFVSVEEEADARRVIEASGSVGHQCRTTSKFTYHLNFFHCITLTLYIQSIFLSFRCLILSFDEN